MLSTLHTAPNRNQRGVGVSGSSWAVEFLCYQFTVPSWVMDTLLCCRLRFFNLISEELKMMEFLTFNNMLSYPGHFRRRRPAAFRSHRYQYCGSEVTESSWGYPFSQLFRDCYVYELSNIPKPTTLTQCKFFLLKFFHLHRLSMHHAVELCVSHQLILPVSTRPQYMWHFGAVKYTD